MSQPNGKAPKAKATKPAKASPPDNAPTLVNRQARYDYHFLDTYTAGVQLMGSEVKSLREGAAQLTDAYCAFQGTDLVLLNAQIQPYAHGAYANHEPRRARRLLLQRRELARLREALKESGTTLVPVKLFFNARGLVKLEIALAKGKKEFDKRDTIKAREAARELSRGES